jgi:hypothetical protein
MGSILTKSNIHKLLKGRQLYDDCRQAKASAHAAESQDDKLQEKLTQAIQNRDAALSKLGFTDIDEFRRFDDEICLAQLKACRELVSVCDHCKGYEGIPPCLTSCGEGSFHNTWTGSEKNYETIWRILMRIQRQIVIRDHIIESLTPDAKLKGVIPVTEQIKYKPGDILQSITACPPGHGFRVKIVDYAPFDLSWKLNEYLNP